MLFSLMFIAVPNAFNTMTLLPQELIYNILDYSTWEDYHMLNKDFYLEWKSKTLDEVSSGICTESTCGHKNCCNVFAWRDSRLFYDDETGERERVYYYKKISACTPCFTLALTKFIHKFKHVPFLRGEGRIMLHMMTQLRENPIQYLKWITSDEYKILKQVQFEPISEEGEDGVLRHNKMYCHYYNKDPYENILHLCGFKMHKGPDFSTPTKWAF
jgi:hypothetical protein